MKSPEFLLIDAGNSRLKWALARRAGPIRLAGEMKTAAATAARLAQLARRHRDAKVALACVVPALLPLFRRAFAKRLVVVSGTTRDLGLTFDYPKPQEIGADRLAAAVAAQADGVWPAIIISCGTAVAFTVLDRKGRLCGGAIAPGSRAQLNSLLGSTAQLPTTTLRLPRSALARSTGDAIRSGLLHAYRGGVKEIVRELSRALPGSRPPRLLLTGGDAKWLAQDPPFRAELRPLLVLEGLRIIATRAFPESP